MTSLLLPKPVPAPKAPPKRLARGRRPRRERKTTLAALKRKLWKLFAQYVLYRDNGQCVTCRAVANQAGHFYSRRIASTWVDPNNIGAQCARCNLFLHGNPGAFAEYIYEEHGGEELARLTMRANRITKQWKADEVRKLIAALESDPSGFAFEVAYYEDNL
jgi:hypothetical protein